MAYFTHSRLMRESSGSIRHHAAFDAGPLRRACDQLLRNERHYRDWRAVQDGLMWRVARCGEREPQIRELRLIAMELIARAARVRSFRRDGLTGSDRARLLCAAWPNLDPDAAMLEEHVHYLRAAVSQVCATDLLALANDRRGLELIDAFEQAYQALFALRCDWMLAADEDPRPGPEAILREATARVARLRRQLLDGLGMPPIRVLLPKPPPLPVADHPLDRDARVAFG